MRLGMAVNVMYLGVQVALLWCENWAGIHRDWVVVWAWEGEFVQVLSRSFHSFRGSEVDVALNPVYILTITMADKLAGLFHSWKFFSW